MSITSISKKERQALAEECHRVKAMMDSKLTLVVTRRRQQETDTWRRAQLHIAEGELNRAWVALDSAARYLMTEQAKPEAHPVVRKTSGIRAQFLRRGRK